jgi:hypothetical protein
MAEEQKKGLSNTGTTPASITPAGKILAAMLANTRPEARGLYYRNKTITLDGYTFIDCRFDNCTLEVTTLNFDLIRCVIDPSTTILYGTSCLKVIQLFNGNYDWAWNVFGKTFLPVKNADGTITISNKVAI